MPPKLQKSTSRIKKIQPKQHEIILTSPPVSPTDTKKKCSSRRDDKKFERQKNLLEKFKNINFSRRSSEASFTVQTLEFPDANKPRTELHKRNECGQGLVTKKTAVDLTSSSNTHFRDGIQTVKLRKRPCSKSQSVVSSEDGTFHYRSAQPKPPPDSQEMIDSDHKHSGRRLNMRADGEWKQPCPASFDAEAIPKRIGVCPTNYEELFKMSKTRQKFFLTQDPRKTHCLANPDFMRRSPPTAQREFDVATKKVKHAENICVSSESEESESFICEVVDMNNPLGLDFQGLDYQNTYQRDEQDLQNQKTYWRVLRYMDRKRVKNETAEVVEKELQEERLAIPPMFFTTIKDEPLEEVPEEVTPRLAELFRTYNKPANQSRIEQEKDRRKGRYKNIYLRNKERMLELEAERQKAEAEAEEVKAFTVADAQFNAVVESINTDIDRSLHKPVEIKKIKPKRLVFPKTLKQTERFQKKMLKENCERRDAAILKKEFLLEHTGKEKNYPEADLDIDCDVPFPDDIMKTPSEVSSDDEDYLQVGKRGDRFKLRGFHYKHGEGLRGKFHRHQILQGKRTNKGCLTREEWLNELVPKKNPVKIDVETGIIKVQHPDDPNLVLFPPEPMVKPSLKDKKSPVREYIDKRLGMHYHRTLRKNLKIAQPRLQYSVRKFNLIRYVFPEKITTGMLDEFHEYDLDKGTTLDYIKAKIRKQKNIANAIKKERMDLLGLPCIETKKIRLLSECNEVRSEPDLDWVPPPEDMVFQEVDEECSEFQQQPQQEQQQKQESYEREKGGYVPIRQRGNMPAPQFRDKTLIVHPRRPRDYATERIPSEQFHEAVQNTNIPIIEKIGDDKVVYANVRQAKRPYIEKLQARHHHDHWKPTQNKTVHVHYQKKIVHPKVDKEKTVKEKVVMENFVKANPPCNKYVDTDLTLPTFDFQKMINDHLISTRSDVKTGEKVFVQDLCKPYDYVFHSREPEEVAQLDFPGRQEYLEFLRATKEMIYEAKEVEEGEKQIFVDKQKMLAELEEDLKSIEGCLTSLSSSECTNLSNDSGSFLLIGGETKLPLDYIRKPLVPFEELERSRFHADVIDVDAEERNPYRLLPFSGQLKAQQELLSAKDSFFTFQSRLRNGLRLRLEVPVPDVRHTLIGPGSRKYYGAVVTDIDENYIDELKTRATVKTFHFKTGIERLKDAMRLKFESLLIQGQIVRNKIYDRLNDQHWENMQQTKLLYEKLFAKWEKFEYETAMSVVYQVKNYYETTDVLKREHRDLERELMMLNMDIVFTEGHWIRCIMLQNFHYLLGDQEWRLEHDWIHLVPKKRRHSSGTDSMGEEECEEDDEDVEYELESYDQSIAKRSLVNIRQRDKDDAWAIRTFYYEVYKRNQHPILQVFPDPESFLKGIENLKNKTFVLLLEMHFTLAIHTELQGRLETFIDWCAKDLKEKEEYVARKSAKKYFMEARSIEMEQRTMAFLDKPIEESFNDSEFNKHRGVIAEVWRRVVPVNVRGSGDAIPKPCDMVAMISDVVMEILTKFESMDMEKVRQVEIDLRKRRRYLEKLSYQAYQIERRIDIEMNKVRRNLEPPYKKPKRVGKLPRIYIKKKVKKVIPEEKIISESTKFFMRAFQEDGVVAEQVDTRESLLGADNTMQEQIVPFYFDHFLKINGYTPNYNFKTQIELRDGDEINRFKIRDVVPDVLVKMDTWQRTRKRIMEENIQRNPKMYENVS